VFEREVRRILNPHLYTQSNVYYQQLSLNQTPDYKIYTHTRTHLHTCEREACANSKTNVRLRNLRTTTPQHNRCSRLQCAHIWLASKGGFQKIHLRAPAGEGTAWPGMIWAHPVMTVTSQDWGFWSQDRVPNCHGAPCTQLVARKPACAID